MCRSLKPGQGAQAHLSPGLIPGRMASALSSKNTEDFPVEGSKYSTMQQQGEGSQCH